MPLQRGCFLCGDQFHQERSSRGEKYAIAAHAHRESKCAQNMALPDSRRATKDNVALCLNKRALEVFKELGFRQLWL